MEVAGPPFSAVFEAALPLDDDGFSVSMKWSQLKDRVSHAASVAYPLHNECSKALKKCTFLKKLCTKLNIFDDKNRRGVLTDEKREAFDRECCEICGVSVFLERPSISVSMKSFDPQPLPGPPKKRKNSDSFDWAEESKSTPEEIAALSALEAIVEQHGAITNFEAAAVFKYCFANAVPEERRSDNLSNKDLEWATELLQKSKLTALKFGWWGLPGQRIGTKKDITERKEAVKHGLPEHLQPSKTASNSQAAWQDSRGWGHYSHGWWQDSHQSEHDSQWTHEGQWNGRREWEARGSF